MDSKKLINYAELSESITGNRNTIRSNRENKKYSGAIKELTDYLDAWIFRNSKSQETKVTIKTNNVSQKVYDGFTESPFPVQDEAGQWSSGNEHKKYWDEVVPKILTTKTK